MNSVQKKSFVKRMRIGKKFKVRQVCIRESESDVSNPLLSPISHLQLSSHNTSHTLQTTIQFSLVTAILEPHLLKSSYLPSILQKPSPRSEIKRSRLISISPLHQPRLKPTFPNKTPSPAPADLQRQFTSTNLTIHYLGTVL